MDLKKRWKKLSKSIQQILQQGHDVYLRELKQKFDEYNINASGKTLRGCVGIIKGNTLTEIAPDHFPTLIHGRKPTENTGNGELYQKIVSWLSAKKLNMNPYAVTKKIHNEGTLLYRLIKSGRAKPREDIVSEPVETAIDVMNKEASQFYLAQIKESIVKSLSA